ncbi:hypothetical protein [Terrabacter sp. Ter38]|uniref:hypothetical protein n=1 Tax=Terrabacter sp. Ter38 TaxID=2926030 RepID=UPI002119911F|nr:hypothetical protein [Terrabacter sp. Ter38]
MAGDPDAWLSHHIFENRASLVWVSDVDDTLVDTKAMHSKAAEAMAPALNSTLGVSKTQHVLHCFRATFDALLDAHQESHDSEDATDYTALEERVEDCQISIRRRWGATKRFSREVLIWIAGQDCGLALTADQVGSATDAYWAEMTARPQVFADAPELFTLVRENSGLWPLLMTSSDARFHLGLDGQFEYDVARSLAFKEARIAKLNDFGISHGGLFVGDPVDKPDPEYFARLFTHVDSLQRPKSKRLTVFLGDSYRSDIEVPLSLNTQAVGVLVDRGTLKPRVVDDRLIVVNTLSHLSDALKGGRR